ncbi:class I SAM-dependent methyltransferase [Methylopila sp. Yamaguchi]|uniref:class I SAM-dependent methyltransferase n=1 Tax=Methylopila sp. Yamaguchi TaxID=1437817 RepID=UPI000CB1FEF2|nr:class I SAM-dependent methyltransferase [Methylopila sp. Yamaguchi]GBD49204.1 type 12 methyltransferase [Methylopila sp. Yamaguchi]
MSGFDPAWLDLREPADHAARSAEVLAAVASDFADLEEVVVADLGCGSGSTLRAVAPHLGARQRWRLIDHDPALLAHARARLSAWADVATDDGGELRLTRGGQEIAVETFALDLAADPLPAPARLADLVAASALFDLVGDGWLRDFVGALAATRRPLYAALSYDGSTRFAPAHPSDLAVIAAFNRHQQTDKGFGPALGPAAAETLARLLRAQGSETVEGASPWRLGWAETELTGELVAGMARAVADLPDAPAGLDGWLAFRTEFAGVRAEVGHLDVYARPPR